MNTPRAANRGQFKVNYHHSFGGRLFERPLKARSFTDRYVGLPLSALIGGYWKLHHLDHAFQ